MGKHLLKPGDSLRFEDRDDLLQKLDRLDQPVPPRGEGRTLDHREQFCMSRYLRFMAAADSEALQPFPVVLCKTVAGQDPPDFTLTWSDGSQESFELTEGSTESYQRRLSSSTGQRDRLPLPVHLQTSTDEAAELWATILFSSFHRKARSLVEGRFQIDHLVLYDLTGLGLLVPLREGGELLRTRIEDWYDQEEPRHRFGRVSVLRDLNLLLDVTGSGRLLSGTSPFFRLPVVHAENEEDLRRRLREVDRYCRDHSIKHLKLFGSVLGDRDDRTQSEFSPDPDAHPLFDSDSDLDLLVEFEPGTTVTLLDMARMERELSELIGIPVDLRTAGDLSRYFRQDVLERAVELRAAP